MYELVNTTTMPGDSMNPDAIDAAATDMRGVGKKVSARGGKVLKDWQGLPDSYEAPEQDTLFVAMDPVKTAAESFGTDVATAATALEAFAEEVRTIKKAAVAIRADAASFVDPINANGGMVQPADPYGVGAELPMHWYEDQISIDKNNALLERIRNQQEALWAAERRCANAINAISGAPPIGPVTAQSNGVGYGLEEIPDDAPTDWGANVERKESCSEKVVEGVFIDGLGGAAEGITSMVGFSWTGPEGAGFSWSTFGDTWKGAGWFAVGAVALSPGSLALNALPGPAGDFFRKGSHTATAGIAGMGGIDLYSSDPFHKWKEDGWRTFGSTGFNIATFFAAPLKVGNVGKVGGASKAGRLGDVAGAAARAAWAERVAGALKSAGTSLDALNHLFKSADLDDAVRTGTKVELDLPRSGRDDVDTGRPRSGGGDEQVEVPPVNDRTGADPDRTPEPSAVKGDSANHQISDANRGTFDSDVAQRRDLVSQHTTALRERNALAEELGVAPKDLSVRELDATLTRLENTSSPADLDKVVQLGKASQREYETALNLRNASEQLGMSAGRDVLTADGGKVVVGDTPGPGRPHELDLVGLSRDGETLTVVEAKGGDSARLGTRRVDGVRMEQGSTAYLDELLHRDERLGSYLQEHPDLARRLAAGEVTIEYKLVHARGSGSVRVVDFTLDRRDLHLDDLVPEPAPAGR